MTIKHWNNSSGGDYNTAGNWTPSGVPASTDDVIIDATGSYTVTSSTNNTVHTLAIAATATLAVGSGTSFTVTNGSGTGGIAGNIVIANSAALFMNGAVVNSGTISDNASGNLSDIHLTGNTTLSGGGKIVLSDSGNNRIFGNTANVTLTNSNNNISGAGQLGAGQMTLVNQHSGVINATGANSLIVNTGSKTVVNQGTMESTNSGGLLLQSVVNNVGGTIQAVGSNAVVLLQNSIQGGILTTGSGGVINASSGGALDGSGTHAVTNKGTIQLPNSTALTLFGTITNSGVINLQAGGNNTDLRIGSPVVTLNGAGSINLSDSPNNRIFGNNNAFQLINNTNTITGAGQIGAGGMLLVNHKLINANAVTNALVLNTGANVAINTGTIESTNTGGLTIISAVDNGGGTILASGAGSHVDLSTGYIEGGTLKTASGGVIQTDGGQTAALDGVTDGAVTISGSINVVNSSALDLYGTITNNGVINLGGGGNPTDLHIRTPTVILQGGGTVLLSDSSNNRIFSNVSNVYQLVNVDNTIAGAGQLGAASMQLVNEGVVNANAASNALLVNTTGNVAINTGTMESTNTTLGNGGLVFQNMTVNNAGGTIEAVGTNTHVDLASSGIQGGTVLSSGGGVVQTVAGQGASLDGITAGQVTIAGTLLVNNNSTMTLYGTINNTGTISQAGGGNITDVRLGSQVVALTGGGMWLLSDSPNNRIYGNNGSDQLININNTIAGSGQLGTSGMLLVNDSVINASGAVNSLLVNTGTNIVLNNGTMESTNTGGLQIQNTAVNNSAGTVQAVGAGAHVDLLGGSLQGGLLTTASGGVIQTVAGNSGSLDGSTAGALTNAGTFLINNSSTVHLYGTIINSGTISQAAGGNATDLRIGSQTVTLTGGGLLQLSDSANNRIYGDSAFNRLINVNDTIAGAGQIAIAAGMQFTNQGLIDATGSGNALLVGLGGSDFNTGTMESTSAGGLQFTSGGLNNAGGTILAAGAGAHVDLIGGASIEGGVLATSGGGVIQTLGGNSGALDGTTAGALTNAGTVLINNSSTMTLSGTINNTGTISQAAGGNTTDVRLGNQTVTLTGGGVWLLSDSANNRIFGNSGVDQLINVNNTISGAGQFGLGSTRLSNSGSILATGANAFNFALGSEDGVNNASGLMAAEGAGGMVLQSGYFTNNGTFEALNGSSFTMQSGSSLTNNAAGDLIGGTYEALSTGGGATLSVVGGAVVEDDATIILSGTNSVFRAGDGSTFTTLENSLGTIDAGATLEVLGGRSYTSSLSLTDKGFLQLGGGTLTPARLTIFATGSVLGFGTMTHAVANSGLIEANGGILTVTSKITGTGSLQIDNAATLSLNTTAESVSFANGAVGTLKLTNPTTFTGSINNLALGDKVSVKGTVTSAVVNSGTLAITTTTGTLDYAVTGNLSGNHFAITQSGSFGVLTLTAGPSVAELYASTGTLGFNDLFAGSNLAPAPAAGAGTAAPPLPDNAGYASDLLTVPSTGMPELLPAHG